METIAVYWEDLVKVYSISEKSGLGLGIIEIPPGDADLLGDRLCTLEESVGRFELVTAHVNSAEPDAPLKVHLLIESIKTAALQKFMRQYLADKQGANFRLEDPVELLYLHGPHFQDRYGIADAAFGAFAESHCTLLLCGCTGTSMYLVVPYGTSSKAKEALSRKFFIPTTS